MFLHHENIRFYDFSIKPTKKTVAFKGTENNDVTRQAKFIGDSYSSKITPCKYATIHITFFLGHVLCKCETNMNYSIAASARFPRYMNY